MELFLQSNRLLFLYNSWPQAYLKNCFEGNFVQLVHWWSVYFYSNHSVKEIIKLKKNEIGYTLINNTRYVGKRFKFPIISFRIFLVKMQRSMKITTPWRPLAMVKIKGKTIKSENSKNPKTQKIFLSSFNPCTTIETWVSVLSSFPVQKLESMSTTYESIALWMSKSEFSYHHHLSIQF